ncbi:MAG: 4Fe-4S ferredoxin [Clostridiaceae bacterium]|nr:4Fe-4S ferredoxin [Clostridiaceae bacterium]
MKILYFTSTGNSLYVAKEIGGELLSIPQLEKSQTYEIKDEVIGIVFPCYMVGVPRPVEEYLKKAKIQADYVFTIMTYGKLAMSGTKQMEKLLKSINVTPNYSNEIIMVDNYLPGFKIEDQLNLVPQKNIEGQLEIIVKDIKTRKQNLLKKGIGSNTMSAMLSSFSHSSRGIRMLNGSDKGFTVTDQCTSCGICKEVCPAANIEIKGKPEFKHKCENCLGCINNCPTQAIQLKSQKSEKRFRNPNIKVSEIMVANSQKAAGANNEL